MCKIERRNGCSRIWRDMGTDSACNHSIESAQIISFSNDARAWVVLCYRMLCSTLQRITFPWRVVISNTRTWSRSKSLQGTVPLESFPEQRESTSGVTVEAMLLEKAFLGSKCWQVIMYITRVSTGRCLQVPSMPVKQSNRMCWKTFLSGSSSTLAEAWNSRCRVYALADIDINDQFKGDVR